MSRHLLVLPMLLVLGACSNSNPVSGFLARADAPANAPLTQSVNSYDSNAIARMPEPGGSVKTIREKIYRNGISQQIILAGDKGTIGENKLEINVQTAAPESRDSLQIGPPSEAGIKKEITSRYPQLNMQVVTQPRQNGLGVFGLAIGRRGDGTRCVFAWQWVDDIRGSTKLGAAFNGGAIPASVRVHMCRADATVDDLAATVEGLTLASAASVERALDTSRRASPSGPTIPVAQLDSRRDAAPSTLEAALSPAQQPQAARPQRATRVASAPRQRRRVVEPEENLSVVPAASPPVAPQYSGGPRYMAPIGGAQPVVAAQAAPVYYGGPVAAAMPAAPAVRQLDSSLPAAAYRGPSAQRYQAQSQ